MLTEMHTLNDDDEYKALAEVSEGYVFIHIDIKKWSKSVVEKIRTHLDKVMEEARQYNIELVFFYNKKGKQYKFANFIRPVDYEMELNDEYMLGAWDTGV